MNKILFKYIYQLFTMQEKEINNDSPEPNLTCTKILAKENKDPRHNIHVRVR